MKKLLIAGAVALGMAAGTAQAAPIITFTPGGSGTPTGLTLEQGFNLPAGTPLGYNAAVYSASQQGVQDRPAGASGNYAAVTAYGSYDYSFTGVGLTQATNAFSFVVGSLDAYNALAVHFASGPDLLLTGAAITNGALGAEGLVTYMSGNGPLFTGVSFYSPGNNSFEFDTISAAVPEPAAWAMMIFGFGMVGGVLRRRSSAKVRFA